MSPDVKISGVMPFMELHARVTCDFIDLAATLNSWSGIYQFGPFFDIYVRIDIQKFSSVILPVQHQLPVPRPNCHIGNAVI
jgi:hypothetical protein